MREKRTIRGSIVEIYPQHEICAELTAMSQWLDEPLDRLDWVAAVVKNRNTGETGRNGLSIESVLRCALLKSSTGRGEALQPVRGAHRHHRQGSQGYSVWAQAQPVQRQERDDPGRGD